MSVDSIGTLIKKRRKDLRITQPHLSELAGISVNTLYKIETGVANPTMDILKKIVEVLGMEITLAIREIYPQNP
jgi:transcriptional regulator with XRE-family HTH domain